MSIYWQSTKDSEIETSSIKRARMSLLKCESWLDRALIGLGRMEKWLMWWGKRLKDWSLNFEAKKRKENQKLLPTKMGAVLLILNHLIWSHLKRLKVQSFLADLPKETSIESLSLSMTWKIILIRYQMRGSLVKINSLIFPEDLTKWMSLMMNFTKNWMSSHWGQAISKMFRLTSENALRASSHK